MSLPAGSRPLLTIDDLRVSYRVRGHAVDAVGGVSLAVRTGEVVAVVGESGSGKSTLAHAILGLLPGNGSIVGGSIVLDGVDLTRLGNRRMANVRGSRIGLVPQDPGVSLNPVKRVGEQVAEVVRRHLGLNRSDAGRRAIELLDRVGIAQAEVRARQYPHEFSGGMRQRALIAAAIAGEPSLIVADEPTSALDVTVQRLILDRLAELAEELDTALVLITHDLAVASDRADSLVVMSRGRAVESGPAGEVLRSPAHGYTRALLASAPALTTGAPLVPSPGATPILEGRDLSKHFPRAGREVTAAVDGVSITVSRGETVGLVGESGSGKSTVARLLLRLTPPSSGSVVFSGVDVTTRGGRDLLDFRRRIQVVYQNPYSSLDPRWSVADVIAEPLRIHGMGSSGDRLRRAAYLLDRVALPVTLLHRRPGELSGGQRQRVAIARAIAAGPEVLVCDEPVSALDVSVQAQVLELLRDLQRESGIAMLFISHDLAVIRQIAHRVVVMRAGRVVEAADAATLFEHPRHPYTRELFAAIPGQRSRTGDDASSAPEPSSTASKPSIGDRR